MKQYLPFLIECRKRLLLYLLVFSILTCVCCFFSQQIYAGLALPMLKHLTNHQGLLATSVTSPFLVPFKAGLFVALILSIPYFLWHLWRFLLPALYKHERRWLWGALVLGSGLFYIGMAFAYTVVLPLVLRFMVQIAPAGVDVRPDISAYLGFVTQMLLAFGFAFETPILIVLLVLTGLVSRETLQQKRSYVIVVAFVLGMLLTPPDVVSQICLAIPLWILFELGVLLAKFVVKPAERLVD